MQKLAGFYIREVTVNPYKKSDFVFVFLAKKARLSDCMDLLELSTSPCSDTDRLHLHNSSALLSNPDLF